MEREKALDNFRTLCAMTASYHRAKAMEENTSIDKSIGNAVMKDIISQLYNEGIAPVVEQVLLNTIQIGIDQDDWVDQLTKRFFDQVLFSSTIEEEAVAMVRLDSVRESLNTLTVFSFNEVQRQNMISSAVNMVIGNSSIRAAIFSAILAKYYCNDSGLSMTSLAEVYRSITVFDDTITTLLESARTKLGELTAPVGPVMDSSERVTKRDIAYSRGGKPIIYESKYLMQGIIERAPEYLISLCQNLHPSDMFKSDTIPREPSPTVEFIFSEMSRIITGIKPNDCMGLTLYDVLMEIFRLTPEKILSSEYNFLDYLHDMTFFAIPGFRYKMLDSYTGKSDFIVHAFPKESINDIVYDILKTHREMTDCALDKDKTSMLAKIGIINAFRDITDAIWAPPNSGITNVIMPSLLLRKFDHTDIFSINTADVTPMIWNLMPISLYQFEDKKTLAMFMEYLAKKDEFNPEPEKEEAPILAQDSGETDKIEVDKTMKKSASDKCREKIDPTMFTGIKTTDEKHVYARLEKKESKLTEETAHTEDEWHTPYMRVIQSSKMMTAGEKIIPYAFFIDISEDAESVNTHINDYQSLKFNIQKFKDTVCRYIEEWSQTAPTSEKALVETFNTIRMKMYPIMRDKLPNDFTGADLMGFLGKSELSSKKTKQDILATVNDLIRMIPMYEESMRYKEIDSNTCFSLTKQDLCNLAFRIYQGSIRDINAAGHPENKSDEDLISRIARVAVYVCFDNMPDVEYSTGIKNLMRRLLVSNGITYVKSAREVQFCIIKAIAQLVPVDIRYS